MRDFFKDRKNCPFCDSRVEITNAHYYDMVFNSISVICPKCGPFYINPNAGRDDPRLDAYLDVWQRRGIK